MRLAVIADLHANAVAVDAVLAAIRALAVDAIACLGDLVGYNAEPAACLALVRDSGAAVVAGNHDRDCLTEASAGTHRVARAALAWTRAQLAPADLAYLASLPALAVSPTHVLAHGSYLSEVFVTGYVTSTMLEQNLRAIAARPGWPPLALCGHTHVPMFGWWDGATVHETGLARPESWPATARAVLINPGSVGQPRDGDPRAAFAVIDLAARRVEGHRAAYDVEHACAAIARAGLPPGLAARLREGR
jgi:diadenosine tetraphosphatase ApaH/serine/threonine PP2A family protein phosphatase